MARKPKVTVNKYTAEGVEKLTTAGQFEREMWAAQKQVQALEEERDSWRQRINYLGLALCTAEAMLRQTAECIIDELEVDQDALKRAVDNARVFVALRNAEHGEIVSLKG